MPSGTLFVVATPIGNLEDMTLRALRVLREVDLIAAEDTRRTAKLLTHHGISTPTISFHAHNTRMRMPHLIARLKAGDRLAVVTDVGTPGVSDPGVEIVRECVANDIPVDPIPGASAPLTAAVASGFPLVPLTVFGFAPPRSTARISFLADISRIDHACVFFDAPTRVAKTLMEAVPILGERQIVVARELTKIHQEFARGTAGDLAARFREAKGEFTVVVGPREPAESVKPDVSDEVVAAEFSRMTDFYASSRRETIAAVASSLGLSPREVYAAIERRKRSVE